MNKDVFIYEVNKVFKTRFNNYDEAMDFYLTHKNEVFNEIEKDFKVKKYKDNNQY